MHTGICNLSVIPLRAANTHRSEMVNQVLFAEQFEILKEAHEWVRVRLFDTNYEGWLQQGQFSLLTEIFNELGENENIRIIDIMGGTATNGEKKVVLFPGTKIPESLLERTHPAFPYQIVGDFRIPQIDDFTSQFNRLVDYYHNSPYLWGGRTQAGVDCSGLSQIIYSYFGVSLPRDAYQQAEGGKRIAVLAEIRPGDLAFFDNEEGRIVHVGLMIDTETIFHASANVRIDKMDTEGIFNKELNRYTHKLRMVKRYW